MNTFSFHKKNWIDWNYLQIKSDSLCDIADMSVSIESKCMHEHFSASHLHCTLKWLCNISHISNGVTLKLHVFVAYAALQKKKFAKLDICEIKQMFYEYFKHLKNVFIIHFEEKKTMWKKGTDK